MESNNEIRRRCLESQVASERRRLAKARFREDNRDFFVIMGLVLLVAAALAVWAILDGTAVW